MDREALIHKNVLDSMNDGVMAIDLNGRIMTFNPAAARILGVVPEEALGRIFGEVFLVLEGMDDFTQTIFDAVHEAAVGHQRVVKVSLGDATRSLALTTSYLQDIQDGAEQHIGVIAVFSDISEIKELRETELQLTESLKAQHAELQTAYREIEQNNQTLASALKKVQVTRVVATVFIISLFLVVGLRSWDANIQSASTDVPTQRAATPASGALRTLVVEPEQVKSTLLLSGRLAPRREVNVISPLAGKVAVVHFQYGERVSKGQQLLKLDAAEVEREYREAESAYIKASGHFKELDDWANSLEVVRARRGVSRARMTLENQRNKLNETAFLLQQGVIPVSEHETAEQQYRNRQLDYEAAQQDLRAVLDKGDADARRIARLQLDNARIRMQQLERALLQTAVEAPVGGVILQPRGDERRGQPNGGAGHVTAGRSVTQGERLLTIGELDSLSVVSWVDEVDISKIHLGQAVRISGEAFPDHVLEGEVAELSSQAANGEMRNDLPSFQVTVAIGELTPAQRQEVRLGMSADLEVTVYVEPNALLVPFNVVEMRDGETWLRVRDKETGQAREVRVSVGVTTVDRVEIVQGLAPGDEVVLSGIQYPFRVILTCSTGRQAVERKARPLIGKKSWTGFLTLSWGYRRIPRGGGCGSSTRTVPCSCLSVIRCAHLTMRELLSPWRLLRVLSGLPTA
jgi:PAS domain S-box-containing protein